MSAGHLWRMPSSAGRLSRLAWGSLLKNATGENPDVGPSFALLGSRVGGRWPLTNRSFLDVGIGAGAGASITPTATGQFAGAAGIVFVPRVAWGRLTDKGVTLGVSARMFAAIPMSQGAGFKGFAGVLVFGLDIGFGRD